MKNRLKRALTAVAAVAVIAGVAPLLTAAPAAAAGNLAGAAEIRNPGGTGLMSTGTSSDDFALRLPLGAACDGDTSTDGYHVFTAIVSDAVDETTLQFSLSGPTTAQFTPTVIQPLRRASNGSTVENLATNSGDGVILNPPDIDFNAYAPNNFPTGLYKLIVACGNGGPSATQMEDYWMVKMTILKRTTGGGPAQFIWKAGEVTAVPDTPLIASAVATSFTATTAAVQVNYTAFESYPTNNYSRLTATPVPSGAAVAPVDSVSLTSGSFPALTLGQQYSITMITNNGSDSAVSSPLSFTPVRPAVQNLSATPAAEAADLTWDPVAPAVLNGDSYNIVYCLVSEAPCTVSDAHYGTATSTDNSESIAGLDETETYSFTVTYGAAGTSAPATAQALILSNTILIQDITVGRPDGELVFTQVCGVWEAMAADGTPTLGFPEGYDALPSSNSPSEPQYVGSDDPLYDGPVGGSGYPYPENADGTFAGANYPTHCALDLGNATLVKSGAGLDDGFGVGQFFAVAGRLHQVTIVDTRDSDDGWGVGLQMSELEDAGTLEKLSGDLLGWVLDEQNTPAFTYSLAGGGTDTYDQTVGWTGSNRKMAPNTVGGAGTLHEVLRAAAGTGLGIAKLDGRITFLIPVNARNGNYAGSLTISAV